MFSISTPRCRNHVFFTIVQTPTVLLWKCVEQRYCRSRLALLAMCLLDLCCCAGHQEDNHSTQGREKCPVQQCLDHHYVGIKQWVICYLLSGTTYKSLFLIQFLSISCSPNSVWRRIPRLVSLQLYLSFILPSLTKPTQGFVDLGLRWCLHHHKPIY